jgi:hypothetical protein
MLPTVLVMQLECPFVVQNNCSELYSQKLMDLLECQAYHNCAEVVGCLLPTMVTQLVSSTLQKTGRVEMLKLDGMLGPQQNLLLTAVQISQEAQFNSAEQVTVVAEMGFWSTLKVIAET